MAERWLSTERLGNDQNGFLEARFYSKLEQRMYSGMFYLLIWRIENTCMKAWHRQIHQTGNLQRLTHRNRLAGDRHRPPRHRYGERSTPNHRFNEREYGFNSEGYLLVARCWFVAQILPCTAGVRSQQTRSNIRWV